MKVKQYSKEGYCKQWHTMKSSTSSLSLNSSTLSNTVDFIISSSFSFRGLIIVIATGLISLDDSHCDKIHSFLNAKQCFDDNYMGKQPVAWTEHCGLSTS